MSAQSVVGKYEYIKPSEGKQTLDINADHTAVWKEVGETSMEKWESNGSGKWSIKTSNNGDVCQIILDSVTKNIEIKGMVMVPGIESGTTTNNNVALPIFVKDLANAKNFGSNKWRKRS